MNKFPLRNIFFIKTKNFFLKRGTVRACLASPRLKNAQFLSFSFNYMISDVFTRLFKRRGRQAARAPAFILLDRVS